MHDSPRLPHRLFRHICVGIATICALPFATAQNVPYMPSGLTDSTLRIDYCFSGNSTSCSISIAEQRISAGWAGRRVNMDHHYLGGNGTITLKDARDGHILYVNTFSTLFQEWQATEEATRVCKAFENVFLLPMPKDSAIVEVVLRDLQSRTTATHSHLVNPADILIRPISSRKPLPHRYLLRAPNMESAIDIAIVAEGYTEAEMPQFYEHAAEALDALLAHEPFGSLKERFNVVAVAAPSRDSGVSIPSQHLWRETAVGSHFDTFYSARYLTTLHLRQLHDLLAGIPYEHIIILANTDHYGGGGIYNSYTLTTARHEAFRPVVVHEFGHSFAGLADEYYYDDQYMEYYYPHIEPWEHNITTMKDFSSKWEDMLPHEKAQKRTGKKKSQAALSPLDTETIGIYEGAGYQSKGVYRSTPNCRMKTNEAPTFCPVCRRSIERLVKFYTEAGN